MVTRRQAGAAIALAVVWGLAMSGCTPQPAPVPSASVTGFASDEEAFAAAEATLRQYIEKSNVLDLNDQKSIDEFLSLSTDEQRAFDGDRLAKYKDEGYKLSGATRVVTVVAASVERHRNYVVLGVCLDVSSVDVLDGSGKSIVSPDRPDLQSLRATVEGDPLRVSSVQGDTELDTCRS